jgi:cytochrome P450
VTSPLPEPTPAAEPTPVPPPPPGRPGRPGPGRVVPLHGPEFAADPAATYARLREQGPIARVELSPGVRASLVTSYQTALNVLDTPELYSKDARRWQALADGTVPLHSPVVPMMMYRPNALYSDGEAHQRLRSAISDTLDQVDTHALRGYVEHSADFLIDLFGSRGEADLVEEYCARLPLLVFSQLFGCPPELSDTLFKALPAAFDTSGDPTQANAILTETLFTLINLKRDAPGQDLTSKLIAHPSRLTDEELVHQIVVLIAAGTQPQQNLICNGLLLLLSDKRFASSYTGGRVLIGNALDEVLWTDPPVANFGVHYPVRDTTVAGYRLSKGEPVVISLAAANTDPYVLADQRRNLAHLAWSTGPHACPAKDPARVIASTALEKLLDRLPGLELAVPADELEWRPDPFYRTLASLPARFPAIAVQSGEAPAEMAAAAGAGAAPTTPLPATPPLTTPPPPVAPPPAAPSSAALPSVWENSPHYGPSQPAPGTASAPPAEESGSERQARQRWWNSLATLWRRT